MIKLALSDDPGEITRVADIVDQFCEDHGMEARVAFDLNLALDELVTNTMSYGFDDETKSPRIDISIDIVNDQWVEVRLCDNGRLYDPFTEAPPPILDGSIEDRPIGGLGVHFVKKLMDEIAYSRVDGCNCIMLRRRITRAER